MLKYHIFASCHRLIVKGDMYKGRPSTMGILCLKTMDVRTFLASAWEFIEFQSGNNANKPSAWILGWSTTSTFTTLKSAHIIYPAVQL